MTREEYMKIYKLVGAAMEVYNELGRGMEEPIYQEAMALELDERGIPYEREKILHTHYKGQRLKKTYVADFYSQGIIVEFKSVTQITQDHRAQLFNYLHITKLHTGIIINYGEDHFHAERYIYDADTDHYELLTQRNLHKYIEDQ